jgi:hypothetical protein
MSLAGVMQINYMKIADAKAAKREEGFQELSHVVYWK